MALGSSDCSIRYRRTIRILMVAGEAALQVVVVDGFVTGLGPVVVVQAQKLLAIVVGALVVRLVIGGGIVGPRLAIGIASDVC